MTTKLLLKILLSMMVMYGFIEMISVIKERNTYANIGAIKNLCDENVKEIQIAIQYSNLCPVKNFTIDPSAIALFVQTIKDFVVLDNQRDRIGPTEVFHISIYFENGDVMCLQLFNSTKYSGVVRFLTSCEVEMKEFDAKNENLLKLIHDICY